MTAHNSTFSGRTAMRFEDATPLRGEFTLSIRKNGVEVEHYADHNMIMSSARDALARLLGGDGSGKTITHIGVGTDGSGPDPADTGLTSAFTKKLSGHRLPVHGAGELFLHHRQGRGQRQENPRVRAAVQRWNAVCPQDARRYREGRRHRDCRHLDHHLLGRRYGGNQGRKFLAGGNLSH